MWANPLIQTWRWRSNNSISAPGVHTARQLDGEAAHDADLVVAIDQGTARVAARRLEREVISINAGDIADDVQDPHRMPLGVWIASLRAYQSQIEQIMPDLRERLGHRQAATEHPAASPEQNEPATVMTNQAPAALTPSAAPSSNTARAEHVAHIGRLFATVEVLPEIVDWSRLVDETTNRLRALAELSESPDDYTLAAALMVIGLLSQTPQTPPSSQLGIVRGIVEKLGSPVDGQQLVEIARVVSA